MEHETEEKTANTAPKRPAFLSFAKSVLSLRRLGRVVIICDKTGTVFELRRRWQIVVIAVMALLYIWLVGGAVANSAGLYALENGLRAGPEMIAAAQKGINYLYYLLFLAALPLLSLLDYLWARFMPVEDELACEAAQIARRGVPAELRLYVILYGLLGAAAMVFVYFSAVREVMESAPALLPAMVPIFAAFAAVFAVTLAALAALLLHERRLAKAKTAGGEQGEAKTL